MPPAYDPPMAVLRLRGPLRRLAGDRPEHAVPAATVLELLVAIEREHPAITGWILDERGRVRRHINVFVNGELGGEETVIGEGDRVEVIPAISGGER
jgi:sulfur-carrier protein